MAIPGQILQVVRAANGAQYIIQQPQQQILLQQQMQPGGVQAPVIQQVKITTVYYFYKFVNAKSLNYHIV